MITSPSSSNALNTKNALAAFKIHVSCRYTVMPKIFWLSFFAFSNVDFSKSDIGMESYFGPSSPEALAASAGFASSFGASSLPLAFWAIEFNVLIISSLSSVPSFAVSKISARYASRASKPRNSTSTNSGWTVILPLRTSWNTFSISCVKRCMRLKPIVPAIPFNEWAARKISLITSIFSGSCSRIIIWSLRVCKCSFVSSIKISRY